ncbi:putative Bax inhibitor 1 [Sarcoptes scabiei]|nr:putative Bax inhibitor 1 [Sarcoptes scabiei]
MNFETFVSSLDRRLDSKVQQHLKYVYSTVAMSVLSAGLGSYLYLFTNLAKIFGGFLNFIIMTGLLLALMMTDPRNRMLRLNYLLGFSFFSGFNAGPLIEYSLYVEPSNLPLALFGTALIFTCFTLSSIFGDRRKTLYFGGLLFSGLSLLLYMRLLNMFFNFQFINQAYIYLALALMCGFVIYDTALIIEKSMMGDNDYVGYVFIFFGLLCLIYTYRSHAMMIFTDIFSIFRYLLVILTEKEREKKRKRN